MRFEKELQQRSGSTCELCKASNDLKALEVSGLSESNADTQILACNVCRNQIDATNSLDPNHWRCLNDSMWSEVPAVQVVSWRMLNQLKEDWAQDLLDMMYMSDETQAWAKAGSASNDNKIIHLDSNGNLLQKGDTVVITETLKVKGSSVTAKRGTSVRNISLVYDNAEQIEGRVDGQQIVILTKFVKKSK